MAYLQTPVQYSGGRRGESRLARRARKDADDLPPMPPVDEWDPGDSEPPWLTCSTRVAKRFPHYLLDYLMEVGPVMGTGSGSIPLTFAELQAWQDQTGLRLQAWEIELLRRLSRDYVVETHRAASPAAAAPWVPDVEENRKQISDGLRDLFKSIMASQQRQKSKREVRREARRGAAQ